MLSIRFSHKLREQVPRQENIPSEEILRKLETAGNWNSFELNGSLREYVLQQCIEHLQIAPKYILSKWGKWSSIEKKVNWAEIKVNDLSKNNKLKFWGASLFNALTATFDCFFRSSEKKFDMMNFEIKNYFPLVFSWNVAPFKCIISVQFQTPKSIPSWGRHLFPRSAPFSPAFNTLWISLFLKKRYFDRRAMWCQRTTTQGEPAGGWPKLEGYAVIVYWCRIFMSHEEALGYSLARDNSISDLYGGSTVLVEDWYFRCISATY